MTKRLKREQPKHRQHNKQSASSVLQQELNRLLGKDEKKSVRKPSMKSRSYAPRTLASYEKQHQHVSAEGVIAAEEFFDVAIGSSEKSRPLAPPHLTVSRPIPAPSTRTATAPSGGLGKIKKQKVAPQSSSQRGRRESWMVSTRRRQRVDSEDTPDGARGSQPDKSRSWDKDGDDVPDFIEDVFDNSDRHAVGLNCLERIFGGGKKSVANEIRDKRPYFTYWVTIVQLIIFIVVMATYGLAPIGFSIKRVEAEVLTTSLVTELVSRDVKENLFIGPTQQSLIHLGAKYSPCMRVDNLLQDAITWDREAENDTACCVNNDGSGCLMTSQDDCNIILSTWQKWSVASPGYKDRTSGAVCGQDPRYCLDTDPITPDQWPDDITLWPICQNPANVTASDPNDHMTCDVIGRPCCVGIQGQCIVTTREYCEFRDGFFHEEAALCTQVNCVEKVCGMFSFAQEEKPDQFYRFFTSLFLHSGILTMVFTLLYQLLFQRDMEKIVGWIPMAFIYIGGGLVGGLASVIFIPYYVETGPSACQMAVLGALFVEVIRWNWDEVGENPGRAIGIMIGGILLILTFGLFLVDFNNWSNLFGFFYGFVVTLMFRPIRVVKARKVGKCCWVTTIVICAILVIGCIVLLVILFYVAPISSCDACVHFNCVLYSVIPSYCDGINVVISRNVTAEL